MQSGIEWMTLVDISIDKAKINSVMGYDAKSLIDNGNIYRRLEKGNQSAVDFISALNSTIKDNPY